MSAQMILLPLFAQVLLTIALVLYLAVKRQRAFASGTRWQDISMREPNWPRDCIIAHNAYLNQFEMPVLFYVLTILALISKQADLVFVVMAWLFVATRYLHAGVFLTTNHVPTRGALFGIGVIILIIMWLVYIVRVIALPWV